MLPLAAAAVAFGTAHILVPNRPSVFMNCLKASTSVTKSPLEALSILFHRPRQSVRATFNDHIFFFSTAGWYFGLLLPVISIFSLTPPPPQFSPTFVFYAVWSAFIIQHNHTFLPNPRLRSIWAFSCCVNVPHIRRVAHPPTHPTRPPPPGLTPPTAPSGSPPISTRPNPARHNPPPPKKLPSCPHKINRWQQAAPQPWSPRRKQWNLMACGLLMCGAGTA